MYPLFWIGMAICSYGCWKLDFVTYNFRCFFFLLEESGTGLNIFVFYCHFRPSAQFISWSGWADDSTWAGGEVDAAHTLALTCVSRACLLGRCGPLLEHSIWL